LWTQLRAVACANPDYLFITKPHPLSKSNVEFKQPNVIVADQNDNIHALIDLASLTICYNSGVGLISIIHRCPTYTVGNAYYNRGGAGVLCESLADAIALHRRNPHRPQNKEVSRLVRLVENA
jgi:capsule polysaccharide modification protein KpsS